jgi:hypothetical protein
MKLTKLADQWKTWVFILLLCVTVILSVVGLVHAQVPQPGLTVAVTATNQSFVKITVTNAPSGAQYELQRVNDLNQVLDPGFVWPTAAVGAIGQTNFVMGMGIFEFGFFRISGCIDCDGDGVPNWQDGNPFDTNVLGLTITIDSPINGANVQ